MTHQLHFKDELVPQAGAKRRQHSVFIHGLDKACCVQGTESRSLGLQHRVYGGWEEGVKTSGMFFSEFKQNELGS